MNPENQQPAGDMASPKVGTFKAQFVAECIGFVKAIAKQTDNILFPQDVIDRAREIVKGEK